jgi:DNA-binding NtrC family response regulator
MDIGVANSAKAAAEKFREREWDVIVTDLRLGDSDGVAVVNEISREAPATISIVLTGFPTLPSAISAIRAGVHDYLIKPCKVQDMLASIKRGLAKRDAIQAEAVAKRASIEELKRLARLNLKLKAELNHLRR